MILVIFCTTPLLFSSEDKAIKKFQSHEPKKNRSTYDKYWHHGSFQDYDDRFHTKKFNAVYAKGDIPQIEKVHEKYNVGYNVDILRRENYGSKFQPLEYALICGHTDLALWLLNRKLVAAAGDDPIFKFVEGIHIRERDKIYAIDAKKYGEILKEMVKRGAAINGYSCLQTPLAAYVAPRLFNSYLNATVIAMLFDNGAQLITKTETEKCNVLHHALIYRHTKHTKADSITTLLHEKVKSLQRKHYDTFFKTLLLFKRVNTIRKSQPKPPIPRNLVYMILDKIEPGEHHDIPQSLEDRDKKNRTLLEIINGSEKYGSIKNNKGLCDILNSLFWKSSFRSCVQKFETEILKIEKNKNK